MESLVDWQAEDLRQETLGLAHRAHYKVWVHWWPLWRSIYTGRNIRRKWQRFGLLERGQTLLDYGCGTGTFTIPAASIVGPRGKVYALDCFPRQLKIVLEKSGKAGLYNIEPILADNRTGLPDGCVDVIWMCDVFHEVKQRRMVLEELHRVLRKEGTLAIYDGMKGRILSFTEGLFSLTARDGKFLKFVKTG